MFIVKKLGQIIKIKIINLKNYFLENYKIKINSFDIFFFFFFINMDLVNNLKKTINNKINNTNNRTKNNKNNSVNNNSTINNFKANYLNNYFDLSLVYLFVLILVVLFILFFKYTFTNVNTETIKKLDYKISDSIRQFPSCFEITDPIEDYVLADFVIMSSYNSFLIGNQKYGYCSLDVVKKVLESGARYIELQICKNGVNEGDPPVIATGDKVGSWINSINSLSVLDVFKVIKREAFNINSKTINHPLFIYLNLKTNDKETLNSLANTIKNEIGQYLLNPRKYYNYPISLERMCFLTNKIVLISKNDYEHSNLKDIIIPTYQYVKRIHFDDVKKILISPDINNPQVYNKTFSRAKGLKSLKEFKTQYPTFDSIINKKTIFDEIMANDKIFNKLEAYNKIGITIVIPHKEDDVFTLNYNNDYLHDYGCSIVPLNFQVNDNYLKNYLSYFNDELFILKASNLRFHRSRADVEDVNTFYPVENKNINIISDFIVNYKDAPYGIEPDRKRNKYLTAHGDNGLYIQGKSSRTNKFSNAQGFIFESSPQYPGAIHIRNIQNKKYLTNVSGDLFLERYNDTEEFLKNSSFYVVSGLNEEEDTFSFRSINEEKEQYLGLYKNRLKIIIYADKINMKNAGTFNLTRLLSEKYISIKSFTDKSFLNLREFNDGKGSTMTSGEINFSRNRYLNENNYFKVVGNFPTGEFKLIANNGKYFSGHVNSFPMFNVDRIIYANNLILKKDLNMYNIMTRRDQYLINQNGTVRFSKDKELLQQAVYQDGELASPAIYGPELGNSKRFIINITYKLLE